MQAPKLHTCRLNGTPFYVLEEGSFRERAIVFLHGLGENRSGINYLFRDLSQKLADEFTIYRFDLAGCGDSSLPLSLPLWQDQLAQIAATYLNRHKSVNFISRGSSSLLLSENDIALNPPIPDFVLSTIDRIALVPHPTLWVPEWNRTMDRIEEYFWFQLGVEAGCLGGFQLNRTFLEQLKERLKTNPAPCSTQIYSGNQWPVPLPLKAIQLVDCHPLFLYQKDRIDLAAMIKELMNGCLV